MQGRRRKVALRHGDGFLDEHDILDLAAEDRSLEQQACIDTVTPR